MRNTILISPFFAPDDSGIPLYNTSTIEYIAENESEVTVLTGVPFYPQWKIKPPYNTSKRFSNEKKGNINVFRVKMYVPRNPIFIKRIIQIIHFSLLSLKFLFKLPKQSKILVVVPYSSCIAIALLVKLFRGGKIWCHIQDFEFDAAIETMNISVLKKLLFKIERVLFNKCDRISTISNAMLKKLKSKTNTTTYLFPNYIDTELLKKHPEKHPYYLKCKKPHLLYSGNIGEKQDWEFFIRLCQICEGKIYITVVGDGAKREWVENQILNIEGIFLKPPVPYEEVPILLNSFDGHILFQKNTVVDSVMPSKLLGMMLSQKPCFLTGNEHSETNKIIKDSKGGFFMSNPNPDHMFEMIYSLMYNSKKAQKMGYNAKEYIEKNFSEKKILLNFYNEFIKL